VSSLRRLISSRANAALSTGPRTEAGKRRSSQNAFRHGCRSRRIVIPENESRQEFDHLRQDYLSRFQPCNPIERVFVEQMVLSRWRLSRLRAIESCMLKEAIDAQPPVSPESCARDSRTRIAEAFFSIMSVPGFAIMSRYEATQYMNFSRALDDFIDLRRRSETLQKTADFMLNRSTFLADFDSGGQPSHDQKPTILQQHKSGQVASPRIPREQKLNLHERSHFRVPLFPSPRDPHPTATPPALRPCSTRPALRKQPIKPLINRPSPRELSGKPPPAERSHCGETAVNQVFSLLDPLIFRQSSIPMPPASTNTPADSARATRFQ
jgi:hypothetical protein